jgi:uncharacterized protein with gpF-like domain
MAFRKLRTLRAVKANPGIRATYRRVLESLIKQMSDEVSDVVLAEYGSMEKRIVMDAWRSPAQRMNDKLVALMKKWNARFQKWALPIATKFCKDIWSRTKHNRIAALKDLGIAITLNPSRLSDERFQAIVYENVQLIQSIPSIYLDKVAGVVQRSISAGFDVGSLADELQNVYGVTERRAKMIANDQTSKATQALTMLTDKDLGFTHGVWIHVPGKYSSRPTHVVMQGKEFDLNVGLYDSEVDKDILPGELINCRCTYRPVIPDTWRA